MATKSTTKTNAIQSIIEKQRQFFESETTKSIDFRIDALKKLKKSIQNNEEKIYDALYQDFNKSKFETYTSEISVLYEEINVMLKNIKKWATPQIVKDTIANFPSKNYIYPEPYGVCLVIGAWNYPLQLTVAPIIGAIAAGNTVIVKPPRAAIHTYYITQQILSVFDEEYIATLPEDSQNDEMLECRYDYIFFTGGVEVGKKIARAAAEHLTPTTLELGGKSPCIVDNTADIDIAAKRVAWGKFFNAGQTCVAPDYLLITSKVKEQFYQSFKNHVKTFYGSNPISSSDYPRIINDRHFDRLSKMIKDGNIIVGGQTDKETRYIAPTLIEVNSLDHPLMNDEIFGPILPVIEVNDIDDAIQVIKQFEKPLAFYLFSNHYATQQKLLNTISFGGGCINDTISHFINHELPFGGVGNSGIGAYHGKFSFDTFTHFKGIVHKVNWPDVPLRYPPYQAKLAIARQVMK
ncbi:MAG: aldehyde dehydrogenase [Sphingobacteriales bacterium]|nr:MAG: aldehyde dehydrogenase [Sphingobacteriales bacterium]